MYPQRSGAKLTRQRFSVLEIAEVLGSVSEACRCGGMDRTSFYEWERQFQTHGMAGLVDLPPITRHQPNSTPPEAEAKGFAASLEHPSWDCVKLADYLWNQGVWISSPTVQKLLIRKEMGSVYDRWMLLGRKHLEEGMELNAEQIARIEHYNPVFKERQVENSRPGELLCQDTFYVGYLKGVGKVYLYAVVDVFSSYAFGFLYNGKQAECAATVLHNDVLPFYAERGLEIHAVLTDNGPEFCGTPQHPFEMYLALNEIEHRRTKVRTPRTNGFIERSNRTVLDEFFRVKFREKFYESVETLQIDLDEWLVHYNTERPHRGYRNRGRTPLQSLQRYLEIVSHED